MAYNNTGLLRRDYTGYHGDVMDFFDCKTPTNGNGANLSEVDFSSTDTNFSQLYTGYFLANETGTWTFELQSDDSGLLWVGNNAIAGYTIANTTVNASGTHPVITRTGSISLVSGVYYPLRLAFGNSGGPARIKLSFSKPSSPATFITNGNGYYFYGGTNFYLDDTSKVYWATPNAPNETLTVPAGVLEPSSVTIDITCTGSDVTDTTSTFFSHGTIPCSYKNPNGTASRTNWTSAKTWTFSRPVRNPVFAVYSLGQPSTEITLSLSTPGAILCSGASSNKVCINPASNTIRGAEGFGIIVFPGTHNSITITPSQS